MTEPTSGSRPLAIDVTCHAGYRGEETPRRFRLAGAEVVVDAVLDQWLSPDHRYFKVRGRDGAAYILRHDVTNGQWELTMFTAGPAA
jgi:hypothetical protein